ncbi:16S rRNA (cytosine(1402)-N(4))-methyltransferase RsmH [Helicobacter sp. 11S02629-2]|uniref:16S rRNA (cytosine(1402)-N(4))-methyltransferase RsmH n=1 Tax=Helicobacter sp. 11S02629-2 TaxID=1476195 RepID=UPI000BA59A55|nr:16S rRNA (cytosine(1402)-N(4))-methyltransferase RsmH [Helicobacter sp. 11S02629-2]PAF43519.1 16S rRNA (cytosine(1402)-N(4))-methyltransferase [Helicobacter sp. 11S02629-2]
MPDNINNNIHIPVLLDEVLETFKPLNEGLLIDCTLGFGGMSKALLKDHPKLEIIGIDRDEDALSYNQDIERLTTIKGNFKEVLPELIKEHGSKIKGVLADIGVSSYQLDNIERGFSFKGGVLDMRMDKSQDLTASYVLNHYSKLELEAIFRDFGEIREYKKLVSFILEAREKKAQARMLLDGYDLQEICLKVSPKSKINASTLAYQALRIEVNSELDNLTTLLESAKELKDSILAIISFHSLEDRLVKQAFSDFAKSCICDSNVMKCVCGGDHSLGKVLTKKPLTASAAELKRNKRSRSAKLRAFKFD